jgi:hypothetical protein
MPKLKRRSTSQRNSEMARKMRERRANDEFRFLDNRRRANSHRIKREDEEFKRKENQQRAEKLQISREDPEFKKEEKMKNASRIQNNRNRFKNDFDTMKSNFESKIREGPTNICSCCGGFGLSIQLETIQLKCYLKKDLEKNLSRRFLT